VKALIISRGRKVEGLGDASEDALFAHLTLGQSVDAACMALGMESIRIAAGGAMPVTGDERVLVIPADVFITSTLLEAFVTAGQVGGSVRLAVRRTASVDFALPLQDVEVVPLSNEDKARMPQGALAAQERAATEKVLLDVFICRASEVSTADLTTLRTACAPLLVEKRELVSQVRLPLLPMNAVNGSPTMLFPFTSSVCVAVRHWVHVLWLNQLAPGILLNLVMRQQKLKTLFKAISGLSFKREDLLQRVASIHPTARVHPSAHVEGSVIGPNAVVGARASVRQSVVAEGAEIGEHATILSSTVGRNSYVTPKTFMVWCAIYPDAVVGNFKLQVSLVGRGAHVNVWAGMIDAKFQGSVRVELDGKLQSTERSFLGSCIGHGAQVAAKVLIHPGRVVPNGTIIVMRPDEVISEIPSTMTPGVPMVRDGGTLKPLASMK